MPRQLSEQLQEALTTLKGFVSKTDNLSRLQRRQPEFVALRNHIRTLGTDSLAHFLNGYTFEGGLSLQQNPDEFAALALFLEARKPLPNYLEIGSASGGTCLFLFQRLNFKQVLSVDDGQHPRAPEQPANFSQIPGLKQYVGDSHGVAARDWLVANLEGKLDVAFIDGDHSYEGVTQDIQLTLPFCRPGTLLIFHDTVACEGVKDAWHNSITQKIIEPLAEYIGKERPLGIGVGAVL